MVGVSLPARLTKYKVPRIVPQVGTSTSYPAIERKQHTLTVTENNVYKPARSFSPYRRIINRFALNKRMSHNTHIGKTPSMR